MQILFTTVFTLLALVCAVYAHRQIPSRTPPGAVRWFTHLMLIAVGVAFGWSMATVYYPSEGLQQVMVFLYGFGAVHIPAAGILFLKRRKSRDEQRTRTS